MFHMDTYNYNLHRVNVLRGIAVLMVFFYHVSAALYGAKLWESGFGGFYRVNWESSSLFRLPSSFGWLGVAAFFSISGYCIHNSFYEKRFSFSSVKQFLIKRFFRIYPAYFIVLVIVALCHPYRNLAVDLQGIFQAVTHLLFIHNISHKTFFGINPSFWSLAVEFQIYLLYLPVLYLVRKKGWKVVFITLFGLEILMRCGFAFVDTLFDVKIPVALSAGMPLYYGFSWATGAFAAHVVRNNVPVCASCKVCVIIPLCIITIMFAHNEYLHNLAFLLTSIVTSMILMTPVKLHSDFKISFIARAIGFIGMISYSIYLLHQPILEAMVYWIQKDLKLANFQSLSVCVFLLIPIIGVSAIFFKYVEIYFTRFGKLILNNSK